jgi:pimeloyl-ACP methyl ester carboxylesterase
MTKAGLPPDRGQASYTLDDMAEDWFALLDALGLAAAHVLGASLGGTKGT